MKIDTLSPAFIAGFVGYAMTGTAVGFAIAAVIAWFALTALLVVAVASAPRRDVPAQVQPSTSRMVLARNP